METPLAQAPDWLLRLLKQEHQQPQQPSSPTAKQDKFHVEHDLATHPGVSEGERNATLCKLVGVHLARGESPQHIEPLALAWGERCVPSYPQGEVLKTLHALAGKHQGKQTATAEADALDSLPLPTLPAWPVLDADALHGLAGEIVRLLEPETEADPVALLLTLLVLVGNCIGRKVWFQVEGDKHYPNLFATLVGQSSRGRKGTSLGRTLGLWDELDPWRKDRISSGLSSGEGLKYHVRDAVESTEPIKEKGTIKGYRQVVKDPGVSDKRLLAVEPELAQALRQMQREGNTLSPVLCQAWDSGSLKTLTKNDPVIATDAHISVLGHITSDELGKLLSDSDTTNGFANRFLWAMVKRSKLLPDGGRELDLMPLRQRLHKAMASVSGCMVRSPEASALWRELYPMLTADRSGRFGSATGRAEAHTLRLSMVYAVLDGTTIIEAQHLRAAYAVWKYCEASAKLIFGESEALPPLERKLLQIIQQQPGSNRKELHKALGGHTPADAMVKALGNLHAERLAYPVASHSPNGGRPCERWYPGPPPGSEPQPTPPANERTNSAEQEPSSPTACEQTNKPADGTGEGVSSFVRTSPSESDCQGGGDSSFVRSPADAKANADAQVEPLPLAELFAEVKAMGGKIVRTRPAWSYNRKLLTGGD